MQRWCQTWLLSYSDQGSAAPISGPAKPSPSALRRTALRGFALAEEAVGGPQQVAEAGEAAKDDDQFGLIQYT